MNFWNRPQSDKFDSEELEKLADQLRQVSKIQLPVKRQQALKRQLFSSIEAQKKGEALLPQSLRSLGSSIREVSQKTALSIPQRVKMKERILSFIKKTNWLGLAFGPFRNFRSFKVALSTAMLLFFVVTSVLIFPFQVPLTFAARLTFIDDVTGQVFVLRAGRLIDAQKNFALQEGDVLITKDNSYVTVRFFDDSVSRLDSNTELEVKRLYSEPYNPVATQVELSLENGHIWTRVLNLIDDSSHFTISTQNAAAIVTNKAAFDLQTHLYDTTLSVFDNVVDFALSDNSTTDTKSILDGFQAHVSQQNGSKVTTIVPLTRGVVINKTDAQWVASNLAKDQIHTALLVQENQQDLVATTGMTDTLQTTAGAGAGTDAALSNPKMEIERQNFLSSYQRLLLGETYMMRGQQHEGLQFVFDFDAMVGSIMSHYQDDQKADPLSANMLFSFIQAKIEGQRKDMATFLPGDPLYPVKEELEHTELYLAGSDVDKAKMQLSQSEQKLLEVQDLIANGQFEEAKSVLAKYQDQIDNLILKVKGGDDSELQDKLSSIFDQQIEQIKELTAIEKSLVGVESHLLKQADDLRLKVLQKLMAAFEKVNGVLPLNLIQELRDLLQTYKDGGAYDQTFVDLLNKMVLRYGKDVSADSNKKLPSELGMVTIVEEDATAAVRDQTAAGLPLPVNAPLTQQLSQQPLSTQQEITPPGGSGAGACGGTQECHK